MDFSKAPGLLESLKRFGQWLRCAAGGWRQSESFKPHAFKARSFFTRRRQDFFVQFRQTLRVLSRTSEAR